MWLHLHFKWTGLVHSHTKKTNQPTRRAGQVITSSMEVLSPFSNLHVQLNFNSSALKDSTTLRSPPAAAAAAEILTSNILQTVDYDSWAHYDFPSLCHLLHRKILPSYGLSMQYLKLLHAYFILKCFSPHTKHNCSNSPQ